MYFEVRTKRLTVTENNAYKTVKELRLFEVENYTEAETRTQEHMAENFPGEDLKIVKISESKISQVNSFDKESNAPLWKVKVNELHEKDNGAIKRVAVFILVQGESSAEAIKQAETLVKSWAMPTEIVKVELTKIWEVVASKNVAPEVAKPKKNKK